MERITTLIHDPATMISIGIGLFILMVVMLFVYFRNRKSHGQTGDNSLDFLGDSAATGADSGSSNPGQSQNSGGDAKVHLFNGFVFTRQGIKFKPVKENLLTTIYCDPSMPKHGTKIMCVEKDDGSHTAFDPRDSIINSKDTAQRAWRATHCLQIVRNMFAAPPTNWEKLSTVFMWVFCGVLAFIGIIALSKL